MQGRYISFLFTHKWVPVIIASFHRARLPQIPSFVIRVMFLKHRFSQLSRPKIFFHTILIWLYWGCVCRQHGLLDYRTGRHVHVHGYIGLCAFLFTRLYDNVNGSLQFHIGLDFSVDWQVGETQDFLFIFWIFIPAMQEFMRFLNFQRIPQKALHPLNMIVLSFEFQLIANQKAQLFLSFNLKLMESFLEMGVDLLLDVGCFCVDLFYF